MTKSAEFNVNHRGKLISFQNDSGDFGLRLIPILGTPTHFSTSDQTTDINRDNGPKIRVENQDGDRTKDIDEVRSISADGVNQDASLKVGLVL